MRACFIMTDTGEWRARAQVCFSGRCEWRVHALRCVSLRQVCVAWLHMKVSVFSLCLFWGEIILRCFTQRRERVRQLLRHAPSIIYRQYKPRVEFRVSVTHTSLSSVSHTHESQSWTDSNDAGRDPADLHPPVLHLHPRREDLPQQRSFRCAERHPSGRAHH